MEFRDKYASTSDKEADKLNKKVISDDAYAVGEMIEELIKKIEHTRLSLS